MNATLTLVIATLALVVGPLLERVGRRMPSLAAWIDGATVGGIVVLAFLHLLPEAGEQLSGWAALWFAIGLMLPTLGERLVHLPAHSWRFSMGGLVVVLLILHEVIESAALTTTAAHYDANIVIATLIVIVGHRVPLGLFIWGQTRARFGLTWSVAALSLLALASLAGPLLVPERFREQGQFTAVLSALLAGGLLHLVLQHRPQLGAQDAEPRRANAASALGAFMAAAFFVPYLLGVEIGHGHGDDVGQFPVRLVELLAETSVPLLAGVIGAALVEAYLPGSVVGFLARGSRLRQAAAGVLVGAPMPVCSCGVLPIYRSLALRGVSPTAGLAFLIAAPEIGVDSFLLSLSMLGTHTTLARLVCALLVALGVGWVVGRMAEAAPLRDRHDHDHEHEHDPAPRGLAALRRGLLETWGHLAPWILFGLLATALVEPWIPSGWSSALPSAVQVVVLALIGMPTYICATAATPFAALLLAKGFSAGAVIAFLLVGPATNVTTFGALAQLHSRRVALAFAATALGATLLLGWGVDLLSGALAIGVDAGGASGGAAHAHGPLQVAASVLLGLLTLWVLVREGPRGFLAQLWPEGSAGRAGAHEHHHGGADHGRA